MGAGHALFVCERRVLQDNFEAFRHLRANCQTHGSGEGDGPEEKWAKRSARRRPCVGTHRRVQSSFRGQHRPRGSEERSYGESFFSIHRVGPEKSGVSGPRSCHGHRQARGLRPSVNSQCRRHRRCRGLRQEVWSPLHPPVDNQSLTALYAHSLAFVDGFVLECDPTCMVKSVLDVGGN